MGSIVLLTINLQIVLTLQIYCQGSVALIWIYILLGGRKKVKEQSRYILCSSTISISYLPGYRNIEKLSARIMKMSSVRSTPADREYKAAFSVVFHQKLKNLLDEEQSTNMELLAKFSKKIKLLVKHFSGKLINFYIFYPPPPPSKRTRLQAWKLCLVHLGSFCSHFLTISTLFGKPLNAHVYINAQSKALYLTKYEDDIHEEFYNFRADNCYLWRGEDRWKV